MNKKLNYISAGIILVFLLAAGLYINNTQRNDNGATNKKLSYREEAIKDFYQNSSPYRYPQAGVDGKKIYLVGYEAGGEINNRKTFPFERGGLIVFEETNEKEPKITWESSELIWHGRPSHFQDINNDHIAEILLTEDGGATGSNVSIYIYKWNKDKFELITPFETKSKPEGSYRQTILSGEIGLSEIKDLDEDKKYEIVVGFRDGNVIQQQIYKFNGEVYELWKEEKLPTQ